MSHYFKSSPDSYNEHKLIEKDISDLLARLSLHFKFTSVKHNLTAGSFKPSTFPSPLFLSPQPVYLGPALPALCGHSRVKESWLKLYLLFLSLLTFSTFPRKTTRIIGIDPFGF